MDIPRLDKGKCSLLIAESATGHVYKRDFTLFLQGQDEKEVFQVFNDFQTTKEFAQTLVTSRPEFEYTVYNHEGEYLATFDLYGQRKL